MNNKYDKTIVAMILSTILIAIVLIGFFITINQTIETEFSCNSGDIDLNFTRSSEENSTTYFELNEINGLTCSGKARFPLSMGVVLG